MYEEKDERFTVGVGDQTNEEQFITINNSDHSSTETYYYSSSGE